MSRARRYLDPSAPPKRAKRRAKREPLSFNKLILLLVMATYFVGVRIGAKVVLTVAPEMLGEYLMFIGAPVAVAIGFYSWKAKNENMEKIKKAGGGVPMEHDGED